MKQQVRNPNLVAEMMRSTPARIGVLRTGTRPPTEAWLRFRHDHALAKDAVHSELTDEFINRFAGENDFPVVQSTARDRADYILFPPKGKRTDEKSLEMLKGKCPSGLDVQVVISDGLSARAIEANAPDVLAMLEDGFRLEKISLGQPVIARLARVAIGDQIAHALNARLVINLIGERPGLSSAVSMSAYMTFNPGPKTISSDRTVVSNIHDGGTPAAEAGAYIVKLAKTILQLQVSGVRLQQLS
ncbi:MAG TPA: ethanolamine ammonia-lyase subunit EutC [Planktothrix sp.]|jgi:ethanolamine ammonia-lyase small subunit